MKLYLGCSLYDANGDYLAFIKEVKNALREKYELLEFVTYADVSDLLEQISLFVSKYRN